jgi:hypothetical protein
MPSINQSIDRKLLDSVPTNQNQFDENSPIKVILLTVTPIKNPTPARLRQSRTLVFAEYLKENGSIWQTFESPREVQPEN